MNILVTGAAGFIGSFTARELVKKGHRVIGIDNFDAFYSQKAKKFNIDLCYLAIKEDPVFTVDKELFEVWERFKSYQEDDSIQSQKGSFKFVEMDILNMDEVKQLMQIEEIDMVVHLAALSGVRHSLENPLDYTQVNVLGTQRLLEVCKELGVNRFVWASSSSVYGDGEVDLLGEGLDTNSPISPYAATKRMSEILNFTYHHLFGMSITNLRFFTVYGPLQKPVDMAIQKFIKQSYHNLPMTVFGDGEMLRDYTYIDDIVSGVVSSVERVDGFNTYNLGSNSPVSLIDLVNEIKKIMGRGEVEFLKCPATEVKSTHADITKAKNELDYSPKVSFEEGLERQIEIFNLMPAWYKKIG
jgi:UDP-glucuronate 4-epimerase